MPTYTRVRVTPDTREWLVERRKSLGASETPAVLGLSPYQTPYDIYRAKHGHEKPFDPTRAFIGHKAEPVIAEWVEQMSGLGLTLSPGFMARSKKYPWLHATFDRVARSPERPRQILPLQFKTSKRGWDGDPPLYVKVQVQQEMLVAGADRCLLVLLSGWSDFEFWWIERDDEFLEKVLIPQTRVFWKDTANAQMPLPMTLADHAGIWPSQQKAIVVSDTLMEAIERRNFLLAEAAEAKAEADEVQLAIANYMEDHDTLLDPDGQVLATYKSQKGRRSVDLSLLETEHPDAYAAALRWGDDFKVLRMKKREEKAA